MTAAVVGFQALIRDTRHLGARAATDLANWLEYLKVDGKADRTLYTYQRELALLLREHPNTPLEEFTAAHINNVLALKPERSRFLVASGYAVCVFLAIRLRGRILPSPPTAAGQPPIGAEPSDT